MYRLLFASTFLSVCKADWLGSELVKSGSIANEQFGAATSVSDDGSIVASLQKQYSFSNEREAVCQPELSGGSALTNQECYEAGGCKWSTSCVVSTGNVGKISVYAYDGSAYNKRGNDIFPSTSIDGFFMKMSGDGNVIMLRERPNAAFNTRAKVAIYGWDGTNYVLRDRVFDPSLNPDPSSFWGFQFAMSADLSTDGSRIIINEVKAPAENDNSETSHGRALVFQWNEGTSSYDLMKTFYGTYGLQKLGESVAISGDGNTVALAHRTMGACNQADVDALGADCGSVPSFCYKPAFRHQNPNGGGMRSTAGSCGTFEGVGGAFTFTFDGTWQSAGAVHGAQALGHDGYTSADDPAGYDNIMINEPLAHADFLQDTYLDARGSQYIHHKIEDAKLGETISLNQDGTVLALGSRMGYGLYPNYGGTDRDYRVSNMGAAAVFDRSSGSWVGRTYIVGELVTHPSTGAVDLEQLGKALDLSADGSRFIVSSISHYGRVKTFQWDGSDYVRQTDIVGQENEKIGQTTQGLQISSDGNDLVSGAYLTPGPNGENSAGKVVVHRWDSAPARASAAGGANCVETFGTCAADCTQTSTINTQPTGDGTPCLNSRSCKGGACDKPDVTDAEIDTENRDQLKARFDSAHPMFAALGVKSDAAARTMVKRFNRIRLTSAGVAIDAQARSKAADGDLRDLLNAQQGETRKQIRRELLKDLAVTQATIVQLSGTKVGILKPAGSTADCSNSNDKVTTQVQIAIVADGESIQYCYSGQLRTATRAGTDVQHARRLGRKLNVDCASATATLNDDELTISAPDGCAYDAATDSFAPCLAGHSCVAGVQTPCPADTHQPLVGQSGCDSCDRPLYSVGTGNVACSDCSTHKEDLKACSCCTGCSACASIAHGLNDVASLVEDVISACDPTCPV